MGRKQHLGYDAFDFSTGVDIPSDVEQRWIDETIKELVLHRETHTHRACGNLLVVGVRYDNHIEVFCTRNYMNISVHNMNGIEIGEK